MHISNYQGDFSCACTPRTAHAELPAVAVHCGAVCSIPSPSPAQCHASRCVPELCCCPQRCAAPSVRPTVSLSSPVQGPTLHTAAGLGAGIAAPHRRHSTLRSAAPSPVQSHQHIDDPTEGDEQPQDEAEQHQRLRLLGRRLGLGHVPTAERSTGLAWGEGERSAGSQHGAGAERGRPYLV